MPTSAIRLATWNCRRGTFEEKWNALGQLAPDLAVITECKRPMQDSPDCLWFGPDGKLGVAIVAGPKFGIRALPQVPDSPRFIIPVDVTGVLRLTLLAVWTVDEKPYPYIRGLAKALEHYEHVFGTGASVLVMGDLNSNAKWDDQHPTAVNHSAVVRRLESLGLASAYHGVRGEVHGAETQATFYMHNNVEKPHHIDYCFMPAAWLPGIHHLHIGADADWRHLSDHRPLVVDVELPAA
jgi:exodeoxyribonuclease-3